MYLRWAIRVCGTGAASRDFHVNDRGTTRAKLDWQAIQGKTYNVRTTPHLLPAAWTNATASGLTASNVLGSFETTVTNRTQFFRILKEDTDPPTVEHLIPADDAIAVASSSPIVVVLDDETGIDTNTIVLSIEGWTNLTLHSDMLSYSNQSLWFSPTGALGTAAAVISNSLTVADTLGHTLSNYTWTFQLGRPAVVTNTFLPLTAPPSAKGPQVMADGSVRLRRMPGVHPLDGTDEYHGGNAFFTSGSLASMSGQGAGVPAVSPRETFVEVTGRY